MIIQDKINLFINRAQTKIAELSTTVASDLSEAFVDSANIDLAVELVDAIESLQSETLQWTDYEKELVVDYYSYRAKLSDIAIVNYSEYINNIAGNSTSNSAWVAPFTALTQKVDANYQEFLDEIDRLDARIDNLDLSTLIPQYLLDEIASNSVARHTHANKTVLDQVTQGHLDAIANNTDHRNNSAIHVTAIQKQNWDAKVTAQQLIDGLEGKANVSHTHLMSEIEGLVEALNSLQPEKGDKGDQGDSPRIVLGEVTVGETLSITIDDTDPLNVIFNFTIPVGQDGKDFKIEVFGAAAGRLSTLYNNVEEGYTYLGTDNGYLYFRKPFDSLGNAIPATTTTGWTSAKFLGSNGWSPIIGLLEVSDTLVVQVLKGWTGGTDAETKPTIGSDPSYLVYLGPNGFTYSLEEAINVKGSQGIAGPQGKIMFPDASGVFADRANYDLESAEFVFLDTETGLIYKKLSSTSGDWSPGYQWKGDKGDQGEPGTAGSEGVFSNWTEDTTGYIKPTEDRKVKADKIAVDVTTFNGNLDNTITDVQKLAEAVDGLQAGSTSAIQPEVSWDGTLKTISIGDSNTEKLTINNTVVSGTIRISYPTDAATVSRSKTLILNNSLNSSDVVITWDTVSGTNYFDWIFGKEINKIKAGEIIYIRLENTSNNIVRLLSEGILDEKLIISQDLPAIWSLTGETQKDVNLKLANEISAESIFFAATAPDFGVVTRDYNFKVVGATITAGVLTLQSSLGATYNLNDTVTAGDYVKVLSNTINSRAFLTIHKA